MRKLLLLAALALAGTRAFAQVPAPHPQPTDRDDTIVLTLPDEGRVAWLRAGRLLARRGYPVRYASPDLLTLSTEPVGIDAAGIMGILVTVEGHELRLQAYLPAGSQDSATWLNIIDRGRLLGGTSRRWDELEAVARLLGGTAQYTRSANN